MSNEIVTNEMASNVLDNVIEVNATRRNYDATSDERRCFDLSADQINYFLKVFNYNAGTVSDGKQIYLDEQKVYFRVPVNISMIESDSIVESYVYAADKRASSGHPSLHVFVDGLKIPDNEVRFYPTKSNVDVFVPLEYINRTGSSFIVEKVLYDLIPYMRYYTEKTSSQQILISITEEQFDKAKLTNDKLKRYLQIYVNKKLYTGTRTSTLSGKTSIILVMTQEVRDAELEILIDPSIQYFFPGSPQPIDNKVIFEVPETYIDSIHGPLSKFSCYFFVDGKRIQDTKIEQLGRLHFKFNLPEIQISSISMCITDREFIVDSDAVLYGCDYYLYNMIGCKAITSHYQLGSSGTLFDGNIDFDEVLNKNGTLYDRQILNELLKRYDKIGSPVSKTADILNNRPYLMRNFLEHFGNETYFYEVEYNGSEPFVYVGLPNTYDLSNERSYDISINTHHISTYDVEIINKGVTDVFKIDAKYFSIGKNTVDILVINELPVEFETFQPSDIQIVNGYNVLQVSSFKRAMYVDDICVLQQISNNDGYNYPTDKNVGYVPVNGVTVEIDDDGVINILFETVPLNKFIVYNKNFSCSYKYIKPLTSNTMDISIPLYSGGDNNPIPFIPRGKVEVYAGTEKLINGIDYFIKHPVNEKTAAGSFLIIRRSILPGTEFDIYFSNMKTKQVVNIPGYFTNNKYGLFYLGNLNYPVSLKYLNIYLNNKKVSESDIDILSDKLIRIHSFNNPMYDLSVESTFSVDEEDLMPFISLYKEDQFELYIESLFKGVYYGRPFDPTETDVPDHNKVYETFIDTVDSVNKEPNPLAREEEWIPSYNDDEDKIGVYNDGSAMGGSNINASIIAGGKVIFAGDGGRVASVDINTLKWNNYTDPGTLANDGSFVNYENVTCITFCGNDVLFGTDRGHIGLYDLVDKRWYSIGDTSISSNINKLNETIYPDRAIRKMIYYKDSITDNEYLFVVGDGGNVATFLFNENTWCSYTNSDLKNCATVQNIIDNIYGGYTTTINSKLVLVVYGSDGKIASCKVQDNAWTTSDGISLDPKKPGISFFNNGSVRENKDIYSHADYLTYTVFAGEDGVVSVYDKSTGEYYGIPLESRNVANKGLHSLYNNTNVLICYNDSTVVAGSNSGKISSYSGLIQNWRGCDSSSGITDNGGMMENASIRSIVYTSGDSNYIIFSGDNGKVCTYNVDVHEVSFRYDPYKTAFLKWYTTPGNAVISTIFDIDEDLASKFSMYHDSDSDNYDIPIGPGDTDLISDIFMNDRGTYPNTIPRRLRFLAEMIQGMGDGRYTLDQAYEYYVRNKFCNILYERDLVPLKGGSVLDVDYDIILT